MVPPALEVDEVDRDFEGKLSCHQFCAFLVGGTVEASDGVVVIEVVTNTFCHQLFVVDVDALAEPEKATEVH